VSAFAYAVVVTHDHALDQRLVQELLRRPLAFLGLVGSVPKQRKFALRLRARGFADADIARVRCPLGMPIGAQTPEEIAVSAMGDLIAVRRGASLAPSWTPPGRGQLGTHEPDERAETTHDPSSAPTLEREPEKAT
jgi:xanthine dehydrogenase accessory factor